MAWFCFRRRWGFERLEVTYRYYEQEPSEDCVDDDLQDWARSLGPWTSISRCDYSAVSIPPPEWVLAELHRAQNAMTHYAQWATFLAGVLPFSRRMETIREDMQDFQKTKAVAEEPSEGSSPTSPIVALGDSPGGRKE